MEYAWAKDLQFFRKILVWLFLSKGMARLTHQELLCETDLAMLPCLYLYIYAKVLKRDC
jgi:hypothetical protein